MKRHALIEGLVFVVLVGLCVAMRLVDHAANFAPVAAAALFGGFWFSRKALALALPVAAMAASDAIIGTHEVGVMVAVYAAFTFPVVWRSVLRRRLSAGRIGLCAVSGSAVFYLSTNLAVWAFSPLYERTLAGLGQCYLVALPFARNTLAGDLFWSAAFFGAYVLAARLARTAAPAPVAADA
jgi:hypothetical protein